jgi:hypothetical protein
MCGGLLEDSLVETHPAGLNLTAASLLMKVASGRPARDKK